MKKIFSALWRNLVGPRQRIKVIYRKNLKMSPGKLAAQTAHAVLLLEKMVLDGATPYLLTNMSVVVLEMSDTKYHEIKAAQAQVAAITDAGLTEVSPGTETCCAFLEAEP